MPHPYDQGSNRLIVQAAEQPSPNHRTYIVPIRGMNTMLEEKYLNPEEGYAPLVRNFLPTLRGTLQKRRGMKRPKTPLGGTAGTRYPVEFFEFGDHEGDNHLVFLTHNKDLRRIEKTSATDYTEKSWIAADDVGGTVDAANVFFGVVGGTGKTFLFFTSDTFDNPITAINVGDGDVVTWAPEGFDKLNAKVLFAYKGSLVLGNTKEQYSETTDADGVTQTYDEEQLPYRFRWSNFGQPQNFKDADQADTGGYIDLLEDEQRGPILACLPFRGIIAVYKPNAIYNLALRSDGNWYAEMKIADKGLIAPKAVAPVKNGSLHFVVSHDNIYLFDGFDMKYPPIGERIRRFFYEESLDWSKTNSIYCKSFPTRNECWVFYDAKGGDREAICWDWERNAWTHHKLPLRCAWWSTQVVYGTAQTSEPKFFGGSMLSGKTGIMELFDKDQFTDAGEKIVGEIRFPLFAQQAGSQGDRKQIQHLIVGNIYLEASVPDANDLSNYTIVLRQSDNPILTVDQTEVLKPAPTLPTGQTVPWRESDRIQFNVGDWNPSSHRTNEEIVPSFYTGLSLTAESTKGSEEISVLEVEGLKEGSQFTV